MNSAVGRSARGRIDAPARSRQLCQHCRQNKTESARRNDHPGLARRASPHSARIVLIPCSHFAGETDETSQPSPSRPVLRSAASLRPPIQIGGPSFLPRAWHDGDAFERKVFATECDVFFAPQAPHKHDHFVGAAGAGLVLDTDGLQVFRLFAAETDGRKQSPLERKSRVASSLASTTGLRVGSTSVLVPNFILRNRPAI